jgi:hypothetical protein
MNPYTFCREHLFNLQQPETACLAYLCDEWADGWTPAAYQNPFQVVLDRVLTLPASPLMREMCAALHGRMNVGVGISFTP